MNNKNITYVTGEPLPEDTVLLDELSAMSPETKERFLHFLNHGKINKSPYESPKEKVIVINRRDNPIKKVISKNYNYSFNKENGFFCRWGKSKDSKDDPIMAPAPEIADIAISNICFNGCEFCYRNNTSTGTVMSLEMFDNVLNILNTGILTQVALSIGSINAVPNLIDYFKMCRSKDLVPNITFACNDPGLTKEFIQESSKYLGAVAISNYDLNKTKEVVTKFKKYIPQTNVHQFLSYETYNECIEAMKEITEANAIVFLCVKPKGRAINKFHSITQEQMDNLIQIALDNSYRIGFDTCNSGACINSYKKLNRLHEVSNVIEQCCSTRFSIFCNQEGTFYPCSFSENEKDGINIKDITNVNDIWLSKHFNAFRSQLINNGLNCPEFDLIKCNNDERNTTNTKQSSISR